VEALLRSTLEKTRCPVPSGHLPVLLSATSNGFYQKNHVVLGKCGPIVQLLRRQSVVAMNNAG